METFRESVSQVIRDFPPKRPWWADVFQVLLIAILCMAPVFAKPTKPAPKQDVQKVAPKIKLEGATNWGNFQALGDKQFTLDDHPSWFGVGQIRPDGKVTVIWTLRATEQVGPGVYTIQADGTLKGIWGWAHDTKLEENGELTGNVREDSVHPVEPEEDLCR